MTALVRIQFSRRKGDGDPGETDGRARYRARANGLARTQIASGQRPAASGQRRVSLATCADTTEGDGR